MDNGQHSVCLGITYQPPCLIDKVSLVIVWRGVVVVVMTMMMMMVIDDRWTVC